jgi:RNase adaptor protein for sRNA GlmZ degradation
MRGRPIWDEDDHQVIRLVVTSFGYLHGPAPAADVVVDLRRVLHNPANDPTMRELTGLYPAVAAHVLNTPGAVPIIDSLTTLTLAYLAELDKRARLVTVAVGCAGGRHRSVAVANALTQRLRTQRADLGVRIEHRDVLKPVICRPAQGGGCDDQ